MTMTHLVTSIKMVRLNRLLIVCCLVSLFSIDSLYSTHIVGGSIRYNCLGDNVYEVLLTVKRDCNLGAENAPFDDPASIGIYNINGQLLDYLAYNGQLLLSFQGDETLQNEIQQVCSSSSNEICVHSTEYRGTIELSPNSNGYILAYQRCCRNSSLNNVVSPLETGMTLSVELTRKALEVCNSSPSFKQSPDIFICEGDNLEFDGSATDADGDELVYSLCTPYTGATEDDPRPQPPSAPPYSEIEWVEGFSAANPLGPTDAQFNSETGMFSIMPESLGQFLVGMCVEEYRDGELLSRVRREFQYNVVRCSNEIASDFSVQQDGCSLESIQFTNNTPDASEYTWFFDYPSNDPAFVSYEANPNFTYPEAGTYTVRLVSNSTGSSCESIIDKHITVTDGQTSQIESSLLFCDGDSYTFRLTDPIEDRTQRQWLIYVNGVQQTASSQFVDFEANRDELIEVELTAESAAGCVETQTLQFNANLIDFTTDVVSCSADANRLRVILSPSPINGLISNAIVSYQWNASNGETVVESVSSQLELDVDFSDKLWVGLSVVFDNGCTAEVERNIRPFGSIFESAEIETETGSSVSFFNNDEVLVNLFDNPNSEALNEQIVQKEWIILSPSQGEIRGEGSNISYTTNRNETIDVIYRFTTESGCVFEITKKYTFVNADLCKALGPNDDICTILQNDPESELANLDCDNDGVDNITECNNGTDPNNPNDVCTSILNAGLDICEILLNNPDSELAGLDCDNDGIDNIIECNHGTDPSDPTDACDAIVKSGMDICQILADDPDNPIASLDCDNDGIDNGTECEIGTDPTDPVDACVAVQVGMLDICALLAINPNSALATYDCDGDGIDNITECNNGSDPSDPTDACQAIINANLNICAIIGSNPNSPIAALDCDGDGFNNADECFAGSDPTDGCDIPPGETINICQILLNDPDSPLADQDCDGGGIDNATECENGGNPNDPNDECIVIQNAGIDICEFLAQNPDSPVGLLDCDNDGVNNITECNNGTNPLDPSDGCIGLQNAGINICTFLGENPNSPIANLDCDGDGVDNQTECDNGTNPNDRDDACEAFQNAGINICVYIQENPGSHIASLDCDNGGIDNTTECENGGDPNNPADECISIINAGINICALLSQNPGSPIGALDCDNDGIDNATECQNGTDPLSPDGDDCDSVLDSGMDICEILANDPNNPLATLDCDGGGIDNATECENGGNPNDPNDECLSAFDDSVDICAIIAANPDSPLANLDCDGDGFSNAEECNQGSDPTDGCDIPDGETIDICAILAADPNSPLGMFDCDGGGIDNATECENGGDPNDPTDECLSAFDDSVDICAILAENPDSPLGDLDCDGDGFTNAEECDQGSDPADGCDIPEGETIDICAILEADPDSPLGMFDCDNGGVDNATECENGGDPNDPSDECDSIIDGSFNICLFLAENPDSPLGLLDCDGDGVDNATECENGTDPLDPTDNCPDGVSIEIGEGLGIPAVICAGVDTPISITVSSTDSLFFEWAPTECIVSDGMTLSPVVNVGADKELQLRVLNQTIGCENEYFIPLNVSAPVANIELDPSDPINRGEDVEVTVVTDASNPTIDWSNGQMGESFEESLTESQMYSVTVTDEFGCIATDSTTVEVNDALCDMTGIYLPSSFSPNGDQLNDVLFVRSNAIETLEFSVYDRWGREVFKSNSIDNGWNGRWQNDGDELPPDAYAYWIKATCFSGEEFTQQGNVSILR